MMDNFSYRYSIFIPTISIITVFDKHLLTDDNQYLIELFDRYGIAFIDLDRQLIFMDGDRIISDNLTLDHIYYIEAHEIAHVIFGNNELLADYGGIELCKTNRLGAAASIGIEEFNRRYLNSYKVINFFFRSCIKDKINDFF
jgi:hypothetical protein